MLTWALILLFAACEVGSSKFSYGKEADRLCAAYKKICPRGKMCAIQTIQWPRPMKFPVCVHEYAMQVRSRVCTEAPSPGGCAAQFRRWYYNVHMAACSWFTYGGCGGNGNNFRTKEECEKVCIEGREDSDDEGAATPANNQRVDDTSFDDSQEDRSRFINGRNDDTNGRHDDRENGRHRDINDDSDGQRGSDGYRYVGGDDHTYPYFPNPTKDNAARDYYATTVESQRGNSAAEAEASAAGLPRRLPSASAYTDRGSVIFDDADLSRRERKNPPVAYSNGERRHSSAADRLSEIAVQAPSIHTVNVHRKVSNGRSHFSHPNAPGPVPLQMPRVLNLLQAPSRASDLTSVASGLNSAFEGRYAADGNETIKRFPKRKRKGGKGKKSRRRGGKSRNGRKGKKQRKTNSNKYPSHENTNSQLTNDVSLPHSFSDIDDNSQNSTASNGRYHNQWNDASRRVAEFRQPQTGYWPEKIQSDEADQNAVSQSTTTTDQQPDDRKDKRGRRRRRRKDKKRQRGERRPTTERNEDRKGGRQYYPEKISLFGLLETPGSNETETPT